MDILMSVSDNSFRHSVPHARSQNDVFTFLFDIDRIVFPYSVMNRKLFDCGFYVYTEHEFVFPLFADP